MGYTEEFKSIRDTLKACATLDTNGVTCCKCRFRGHKECCSVLMRAAVSEIDRLNKDVAALTAQVKNLQRLLND